MFSPIPPHILPRLPRPLRTLCTRLAFALGAVSLSAAAFGALATASAQAALIEAGACNEAPLSQPFLPWGDASSYELFPGGDFEGSLAGWTFAGGAQRAPGSEPYGATGHVGEYSLELPAGATAQSPYTCVNAGYPTFRFFARSDGGPLATVLVQLVYKTGLGTVQLPLGVALAGGQWEPTLPLLTGSAIAGAVSGGTVPVALRFTALVGSASVDDVFVDPRMK